MRRRHAPSNRSRSTGLFSALSLFLEGTFRSSQTSTICGPYFTRLGSTSPNPPVSLNISLTHSTVCSWQYRISSSSTSPCRFIRVSSSLSEHLLKLNK
eukprot:sb/3478864/